MLYHIKCETCGNDEYKELDERPKACTYCGETEYVTIGVELRDEHELRLGVK